MGSLNNARALFHYLSLILLLIYGYKIPLRTSPHPTPPPSARRGHYCKYSGALSVPAPCTNNAPPRAHRPHYCGLPLIRVPTSFTDHVSQVVAPHCLRRPIPPPPPPSHLFSSNPFSSQTWALLLPMYGRWSAMSDPRDATLLALPRLTHSSPSLPV